MAEGEGFEPTVRLPAQRETVNSTQIATGGKVNSRWLQATATRRIAGFLLCRENCREQFLKLQIKAVASPRNRF